MKRLPEKIVMAAIILSCGVVSHHLDQTQQNRTGKRVIPVSAKVQKPVATEVAAVHSAKAEPRVPLREQLP